MLRMEIAMYYTIQKLEVHMKGLEQNQLPKFVVNVQEQSTSDMIKRKELDLKHKLNIK